MFLGDPSVGMMSQFQVNALAFNGSGFLFNSGLSNLPDSYVSSISFWFRLDGGDGTNMRFIWPGGVVITRTSANKINALVANTSGSTMLSGTTVNTYTASSIWHSLCFSCNTNFSAGNKLFNLIIDGASDVASVSDGLAADKIGNNTFYSSAVGIAIGNDGIGVKYSGSLAESYVNAASYIDFSNSANVQLFRSSLGQPVFLGYNGSIPTGSAPCIYINGASSSAGNNAGTGGNLTITPTITDTNPPL